MKIFISADIEGVSGVVHAQQTVGNSHEYERAIKLMTGEVNAAIEGAVEAGATEIIVNDSHNFMRNIIIEDLNPAARLITGFPKRLLMMEGIDRSFDGAMFIGYHSMTKNGGILAHQISGSAFAYIKINDALVGETALNAAVAGYYNVPLLMVSGDDMLEKEVSEFCTDVEFARVKTKRGSWAGECLVPSAAQELIKQKAFQGVSNIGKCKPYVIESPLRVEVGLKSNIIADVAEVIPGIKRISNDVIVFEPDDIIEGMKMLFTIMAAACIVR